MVRVLTDEEIRRVEQWARNTEIEKMLSFFEELPHEIQATRPLLLGSKNWREILFDGFTTTTRVISEIKDLDEPFNPNLAVQEILLAKKRKKRIPGVLAPMYQQLRKGFGEVCLLERLGNCSEQIIRAHSLQKSVFKAYAKDGHVYQFDPLGKRPDSERRFWPERIGVNEATTFTSFCGYHDSQIFSPIENHPFRATDEQIFLYHYRALAYAYYDRCYKFKKVIEDHYEELVRKFGANALRSLAKTIEVTNLDQKELEAHKCRLDEQLQRKAWTDIEGYVFVGERMPDILATDFTAPNKTFTGRIIQNVKSRAPLAWVSLTATAVDGHALVLLSADRGSTILRELVASLRELAPDLRTMAIVNRIFCSFENFVILPAWWESLLEDEKLRFVNAFNSRYYPRELPNRCDWRLTEIS